MVVVSMVFIFIAKLGVYCRLIRNAEPRYEPPFQHRHDLHLLALLLIYRLSSTCLCRSALLFSENLIIHNVSAPSSLTSVDLLSSVTNTDESSQDTSSFRTSISTKESVTDDEENSDSLYIVRNNLGDTFLDIDDTWLSCSAEKCTQQSGGTAAVAFELDNVGEERKLFFDRHTLNDKLCHCRCHQNNPTFREDLQVCVNDIHECSLISFSSNNGQQKIPLVFLPLRGQIIYPNAEIKFHGVHSVPTCIVSRVRYLSRSGWCDIKNYSDERTTFPFRLFHDKQRTFLQWLGSSELRVSMEGRLLLIDLMCKDLLSQLIFTPCISFRVAGVPSPSKFFPDEILDRTLNNEREKKFSAQEYVALGFATLLITLIYIASVFMYLHFKKSKLKETSLRRSHAFKQFFDAEELVSHTFNDGPSSSNSSNSPGQSKQLIVEQEGLIKNNPLLMKRYHSPASPINNRPLTSVEDVAKYGVEQAELHKPSGSKLMMCSENALVGKTNHFVENLEPRWSIFCNRLLQRNFESHSHSEGETRIKAAKTTLNDANNIEEKHPDEDISIVECPEDMVPANAKHKLYFNPAYLEPELLMAPPPAAIEFLFKIREIMSMARRKLLTKKFLPTLTKITEETRSHGDSTVTRETSSSRRCVSKKQNSPYLLKEDKEKRQIIQKWLQTIPTSDGTTTSVVTRELSTFLGTECDHLNDSLTLESGDRYSVEENKQINEKTASLSKRRKAPEKPKRSSVKSNVSTLSKESLPSVTEMSLDSLEKRYVRKRAEVILEDGKAVQKNSLPREFGSNLPLDEELTMQNAIFNVVTGNTTISKLKMREHPCFESQENSEENKYSLVSEVYVNDEFSSNDSVSSEDSFDENEKEMKEANDNRNNYNRDANNNNSNNKEDVSQNTSPNSDKKFQESSRLMIQLNDCPFFYSVENAEDFEPDTLDRKVIHDDPEDQNNNRLRFIDSLERPAICLRSHGSFRDQLIPSVRSHSNSLKRSFGSLQEIYQSRKQIETDVLKQSQQQSGPCSLSSQIENILWKNENCTPRHYFRQCRQSSPPPLPQNENELSMVSKPGPLSQESEQRSRLHVAPDCNTNGIFANRSLKLYFNNHIWSYRPDDSGYLSGSDSENSQRRAQMNKLVYTRAEPDKNLQIMNNDEDEDDSCSNDDNSESGAESTATNFKFYKSSVKSINDSTEPIASSC